MNKAIFDKISEFKELSKDKSNSMMLMLDVIQILIAIVTILVTVVIGIISNSGDARTILFSINFVTVLILSDSLFQLREDYIQFKKDNNIFDKEPKLKKNTASIKNMNLVTNLK